jgi:glyoxylase-like metal-dependent hydrolase (beta-lactamase superfamily II)
VLKVIGYSVGPLDNNTYLVADEATGEAVIVDPSFGSRNIWEDSQARGLRIVRVLNTHAHLDHVAENAFFVQRSGASLAIHPAELPLLRSLLQQALWMGMETPEYVEPNHLLSDEETIPLGESSLKTLLTAGHSPGGVSFLGEGFVLVGDALFAGSIGRTDLPGGNHAQLIRSIRTRLLALPDSVIVYPGHGPQTTIGAERLSNPFL